MVVQPDTAIVDKYFNAEKDSIEAINLRDYYARISDMESMLNFKGYPKALDSSFKKTQRDLAIEIPVAKAQEPQVKKFKYFQTISQYSSQVYNYYFNEYAPFSTIYEIPWQDTSLANLKMLADTSQADYIVFYRNIHSGKKNGLPILKLTTLLYAHLDNKIILCKETEGDSNSRGDMWTCSIDIILSCLLINGVKTSTDEVAKVLQKRQLKQTK